MKINNNMLEVQSQTQVKKIEVVVGALTENDVKDHGTATGVVKTVNKQSNKIRQRQIPEIEDAAKRVRTVGKANEVMGIIKRESRQNPSLAISAQVNQVAENVLNLIR